MLGFATSRVCPGGQIGLFFAQTTYPGVPGPASSPIHFFTELTFNDRVDVDANRQLIAEAQGISLPPIENSVGISTYIHAGDQWHGRRAPIPIPTGPHFKVIPQVEPRWHDVEVVVTPESVNARWDGQPISVPLSVLQYESHRVLIVGPPGAREPVPRDFRPAVKPRGGSG